MVAVWPAGMVPVQLTAAGLTTLHKPIFVVQVPGRANNCGGSEAVKVPGCGTAVGFASVAVTLTTLPGPVQASGSATVTCGLATKLFVNITVNPQVATRFDVSVAVQLTGVVPRLNIEPDAGVHTTEATEQLSIATGGAKLTASESPAMVLTMLAGQVITGFWLSFTVTVKLHRSPVVLLQVTVVTPFAKVDPDGMSQVTVPQLLAEGAG